jgi:hypothetical protein
MADALIFKDTDTTVSITVKDDAGVAIDLTGFSGIVVRVFQDQGDIDKFSLNAQAGFRSLVITDAVNGIFEIYLNADNLNGGTVDEWLFYEVKTQAVNANFDSSTEDKSGGKIRLAILKQTELKNTTFV